MASVISYTRSHCRDNAWFSSLFTKHRPDIIEHFGLFGNTTIFRPIEKVRPIKMLHYVMNLKLNRIIYSAISIIQKVKIKINLICTIWLLVSPIKSEFQLKCRIFYRPYCQECIYIIFIKLYVETIFAPNINYTYFLQKKKEKKNSSQRRYIGL